MFVSETEIATLEPAPPAFDSSSAPSAQERDMGNCNEILCAAIQNVSDAIAPVWPLKDFVAVNPYLGLSGQSFLNARRLLQSVCDCETLMPLKHYQSRFQQKQFSREDVEAAMEELGSQNGRLSISVDDVLNALKLTEDQETSLPRVRRMRTLSEYTDDSCGTSFSELIQEDIGRHLAAHYDEGQAAWSSPWQQLELYQAWRSAAMHDRRLELMGVSGCCRLISTLPENAEAAVGFLLNKIGMPKELWEPYLLCLSQSVPGWSSWAKYHAGRGSSVRTNDFVSLLAIRLSYDVATAAAANLRLDWLSVAKVWGVSERSASRDVGRDALIRLALLRAAEIAFQRQLLGSLSTRVAAKGSMSELEKPTDIQQPLAQLVFCIDVRSERYRRNVEAVSGCVETFGFAGFFGMPIAFQAIGEDKATPQVPALLSPSFTVEEGMRDSKGLKTVDRRELKRLFRNSWKRFQSSAASCFGFVETAGFGYGWKLLSKSLNRVSHIEAKFDGVDSSDQHKLGPVLTGLDERGIGLSQKIDLAEGALRGIGLTGNFAKLVVFCGHGSQVQNNPLQAGLDCGACCGHSGEPNARFAAMLLNQNSVRRGLAERGIHIPIETHFLAALHNTTSDQVTLFETDLLPESLGQSLSQLLTFTTEATRLTRLERLPQLNATNEAGVLQRTRDWSEVRPEWGLAGNAAFIVAPRKVTEHVNLDGRSFLHSYDYRTDVDFKVLEQIMTAPMVVGHWINMQYYASTVDNQRYGSGSKTIHNVVGKFGVFSGNGGDLTTGLPWQSIHNGKDYQHEPLRLLAVIAAPRDAVAGIIERNQVVEELLVNGWLNLVVLEEGDFYQYTTKQTWRPVQEPAAAMN